MKLRKIRVVLLYAIGFAFDLLSSFDMLIAASFSYSKSYTNFAPKLVSEEMLPEQPVLFSAAEAAE